MKTIVLASLLSASLAHAAPAKQATPKADGMVQVATCRDGKTMFGPSASEHRGACSGHGGVTSWADGSPVKGGGKKNSYR